MEKANLYDDLGYDSHKPIITVLIDTSFTRELRIAMNKGTTMKEHKAPHPIIVEIVDGTINFGIEGDQLDLVKGDILTLEGNVLHSLHAEENSIVRLTLSLGDKVKRVKSVIDG